MTTAFTWDFIAASPSSVLGSGSGLCTPWSHSLAELGHAGFHITLLTKVNGFLKNCFSVGLRCLSSFRIHNHELSSGTRCFKPFM